jgi:DNA-binding response OmpR family regulator
MYKILIIEDDKKIAEVISENIFKWGYDGRIVSDFSKILEEFSNYDPHLLLLDINLPLFDGFYWCSKIRMISKIPIIFVSARDSNMDIIMAVNMGGDDYITKPFSIDLLMAKINALFRRVYSYQNSKLSLIEYNGIFLNLNDFSVTFKDKKIELTKNETKVMQILMENAGSIVTRYDIAKSLWDSEDFVDDNTLTVNINRVRKKLEDVGLKNYIQTKKNEGYTII